MANPTTQITHVIFDMDGLLLDTETAYTKATQNITQRYNKDYTFELKQKLMGRSTQESAKILLRELELPLTVEEYIALANVEYTKVFSEYNPPMPGAERLVKHLSAKGIPIAVCTSSRFETYKLKTSPHQEFFALFDHITIAGEDPEITRPKPDPQPFQVCASRFTSPPSDMAKVLVFEDSVAGVQAANAAGMKSVWVPDSRMDKSAVKAFLTLDSLEQFQPEKVGLPAFD